MANSQSETRLWPADGGTDSLAAPAAEESKADEVEDYRCYIESTDLRIYLQDAVASCLDNDSMHSLQGTSEEKTARFGRWMASYFDSMLAGRHVFGRRLAFIMATQYNRLSFVHMVTRLAVEALAGGSEQAAAAVRCQWRDLFCLVQLVCPEYPDAVVRAAFMLAQFHAASEADGARRTESAAECGTVRLSALLCTFEVYVRFAEFVRRCGRVHATLLRERELNRLTEHRAGSGDNDKGTAVTGKPPAATERGQKAWLRERTPVLCHRWLETLSEEIYRCDDVTAAEQDAEQDGGHGGGGGERRSRRSGSYDRPSVEALRSALASAPDKVACSLPELLLRIARHTTGLVNRLPAASGEST